MMREIIERAQKRDKAFDISRLTAAEHEELTALGILDAKGAVRDAEEVFGPVEAERLVDRQAIQAPQVLNEAYDYALPSSFSRGLRVDLGSHVLLFISGTASVDGEGRSVHVGDFRAQCWRTYRNITQLLESEGATWHDVVKCTCYLRDIERDYRDFNEVRTAFFNWLQLNPLPASVGVQTRLCREDLLVEIEGLAIIRK
jgi:2-iminobutanoate/2-iminopropanoate deaminase